MEENLYTKVPNFEEFDEFIIYLAGVTVHIYYKDIFLCCLWKYISLFCEKHMKFINTLFEKFLTYNNRWYLLSSLDWKW